MKRDLIDFSIYSGEEIQTIFTMTDAVKRGQIVTRHVMDGKTAALIFEKPSLRTKVSFEVGVAQLGGQSVFLAQQQIGIQTRESVQDIAEVLSRYNDMIIARTMTHQTVCDLAKNATIPVINALTDLLHPCQILADAYTLHERERLTPTVKIAFIGDGNNIVNSWLELAEKVPMHFVVACPEGYEPDAAILNRAGGAGISRIEVMRDPFEAAEGADVLYTDVWVSMGQEEERARRQTAFERYQINEALLAVAKRDCLVMHCLPAHRGEEITQYVLEGPHSIVMEEAENRLHVQKSIMMHLLEQSSRANTSVELKKQILAI